jgi:hypothetical protein
MSFSFFIFDKKDFCDDQHRQFKMKILWFFSKWFFVEYLQRHRVHELTREYLFHFVYRSTRCFKIHSEVLLENEDKIIEVDKYTAWNFVSSIFFLEKFNVFFCHQNDKSTHHKTRLICSKNMSSFCWNVI